MKLQYEILKKVFFKDNAKITIMFIFVLILYFLIMILFNNGNNEQFNFIFGYFEIGNFFSFLFFLFHVGYFIFLSYKFIIYELSTMIEEIILRIKYRIWSLNKITIFSLFLLLYKFFLYFIFNVINYIFKNNWYFSFNFFLRNLLIFIDVFLLVFNSIFFKHKLINICINLLMLLLIIKFRFIRIIVFIFYYIMNIFATNFKKIIMCKNEYNQ